MLGKLLGYFSPVKTKSVVVNKNEAYIYVSSLAAVALTNIVIERYVLTELFYCGMKIRVACSSIIYRKVTFNIIKVKTINL